MLLRVEPARRDVGVPCQHHFIGGRRVAGRPGAAHERGGNHGRRDRRTQDVSSCYSCFIHPFLPYYKRHSEDTVRPAGIEQGEAPVPRLPPCPLLPDMLLARALRALYFSYARLSRLFCLSTTV